MRKLFLISGLLLLVPVFSFGQAKHPRPRPTPAKTAARPSSVDLGTVSGRTYTNKMFGIEVTFPDSWLIPDRDFEEYMKKQGFDLSLKAPDSLPPATRTKIDDAIKRVAVLVTAYRSMPGSDDNAIVRISVEDLVTNPQITDAVDYFDAVRAMYATMQLPADFKYSETQAEKLGALQFGFLDATSNAGKKRIYATIRDGYAVLFSISYTKDDDLQTFRHVLEQGNFAVK